MIHLVASANLGDPSGRPFLHCHLPELQIPGPHTYFLRAPGKAETGRGFFYLPEWGPVSIPHHLSGLLLQSGGKRIRAPPIHAVFAPTAFLLSWKGVTLPSLSHSLTLLSLSTSTSRADPLLFTLYRCVFSTVFQH